MTVKQISDKLFPAQAGVIPRIWRVKREEISVPRASGGDPADLAARRRADICSPRKRG